MRDARAAVLLDAGGDPQLIDVQVRDPVDDEGAGSHRCGAHLPAKAGQVVKPVLITGR